MYCNEAYTVDNEAVEDWTSSLQMLLTFAAIFSAVLVTLIVDSKMLLEQDNTDVLVDAIIFLINDLANGTHRPYTPPKFQPSTRSILVNCSFYASLCLSIATTLGAVLAMQWVTDYGAVTRRAGSTPEERVKRRHFRYQGGQDWKMDTIVGALPICLHLSVVLFFVGLIIWMWDIHHSVFAVVVVCGVLAGLFYIVTTTLAIFCPSCPYRTPLASWIYAILHLLIRFLRDFTGCSRRGPRSDGGETETGQKATTGGRHASKFQQIMITLYLRFAQTSLSSRDDAYIRSPNKQLTRSSLIWLSNHISISPEVYRRLFILVKGFLSVADDSREPSIRTNVPWRSIFRGLGSVYQSFVQNLDLDEVAYTEFIREAHCLRGPGVGEILESLTCSKEARFDEDNFPIHLLHVWTRSVSSHITDALRAQRFSDENTIHGLISGISPTKKYLLKTWFALLDDEAKACEQIIPRILSRLNSGSGVKLEGRLNATLYIISTGRLPWGSTVQIDRNGQGDWRDFPSDPCIRRFRVFDWINRLDSHPHKGIILECLGKLTRVNSPRFLFPQTKPTLEEEVELQQMGIMDTSRWTRLEERLYATLVTFDRILGTECPIASTSRQVMLAWMLRILCEDLMEPGVSLDLTYFRDKKRRYKAQELSTLSDPFLRLLASLLGIEWPHNWPSKIPDEPKIRDEIEPPQDWLISQHISQVLFKRPSILDGDCTGLVQFRLRHWHRFDGFITFGYITGSLRDLKTLMCIEQEIKHTRLGIDHAGDFFLVLVHLNCAYGWRTFSPQLFIFIPDILVGNTTATTLSVSQACIDHLASICQDINADPTRLIRLLIELIRADINYRTESRKPHNLYNLLTHAKNCLSPKEIRPFSPSCRRLAGYIKESYNQFMRDWDESLTHSDPLKRYTTVDKEALKAVCEEVLGLLEPTEPTGEEEAKDISWPRHLLRPTGRFSNPFRGDAEPMVAQHQIEWDYSDANELDNNVGDQEGEQWIRCESHDHE
ncbi:hypothetical protein FRC19_002869 [Serendipita sp. 401]|nr:hypothetical protein FRC19_002869 [Serendipita sp. 401]